MRYLLDTNVISDIVKPVPPPALLQWMSAQDDGNLFVAAWTIAEIKRGVLQAPAGKRRRALESWFDGPEGPQALFAGRVLPFDEPAALIWAKLMADGTRLGKPRSAIDTIIAAVATAHDCTVVTNNDAHFHGVRVLNPQRPAKRR